MRDTLWKRQSSEQVDISHAVHFPGGKYLCVYTAFLRRVAGLAVGTARDERVGRGVFRTPVGAADGRVSRACASDSRSVVTSVCSRTFSA
jgi:hypothetical protein